MKKPILIMSILLVSGLYSCSEKEWQHKPSKTFTREGMLCTGAWDLDLIRVTTQLNGEVTEDHSDSVNGTVVFKKDHTVEISIPGEFPKTIFWSIRVDTLKLDHLEYKITALSRNRLELYRETYEIIPAGGIAYTQTESQMTR